MAASGVGALPLLSDGSVTILGLGTHYYDQHRNPIQGASHTLLSPLSPIQRIAGVAALVLIVGGGVAYTLFLMGGWASFSHQVVHIVHNHLAGLVGGIAGAAILVSGAVCVILRVSREREQWLGLLEAPLSYDGHRNQILNCKEKRVYGPPRTSKGTVFGCKAKIEREVYGLLPKSKGAPSLPEPVDDVDKPKGEVAPRIEVSLSPLYVDRSTVPDLLSQGKTAYAYAYSFKPCSGHYSVSASLLLVTPWYTVARMIAHTLRAALIPFYVAGCLIREQLGGKKTSFTAFSLIEEPAQSLFQVVKAPFYGLAFLFSVIYSFIKPMEGRILGAAIERDWNSDQRGVRFLQEGWWSVGGPQKLCQRHNMPFFLAGCWQPVKLVAYHGNGATEVFSISDKLCEGYLQLGRDDLIPEGFSGTAQPKAPGAFQLYDSPFASTAVMVR